MDPSKRKGSFYMLRAFKRGKEEQRKVMESLKYSVKLCLTCFPS